MTGRTAWQQRNTPFRLISQTRSHSSETSGQRFVPRNARVVHQNVDGPKPLDHLPDHRLGLSTLRHIHANHQASLPSGIQLARGALGFLSVCIREHDPGSRFQEPFGNGCADASGCAGDDGNFVLKRIEIGRHGVEPLFGAFFEVCRSFILLWAQVPS
jgi:hypothetical protein